MPRCWRHRSGESGRAGVVLVVALAVAVAGILALVLRRDARPREAPEKRSRLVGIPAPAAPGGSPAISPPPPGNAVPTASSESPEFAALRRALDSGKAPDARKAAMALRGLLRQDEASRRRAIEALLAEETPARLRAALALVLGTFERPDTDAVLREALSRFGSDPAFARAALLALGAAREPEDEDDAFDRGSQPYGYAAAGGLAVTVRRTPGDAATRAALAGGLGRAEPEAREAAAAALRHSLAYPGARDAFLAAVARESSDDVASIVGEALAERAGAAEDTGERHTLVTALLARAGDEGLDEFRFRMENDFRRIELAPEERAALADLASDARPFGTRSFAMTSLANSAAGTGGEALPDARNLLGGILGRDADPAARDLAARLLGTLPGDDATGVTLARAARQDAAWNVRFTALESLASKGPRETALEALRAARNDPDARVSARADELLRTVATR